MLLPSVEARIFPVRVSVSDWELDEVLEFQERDWRDWLARMSCNSRREVWPSPALGYSRQADRRHVEGLSEFLDEVVALVLDVRPIGGRFFINASGVWTCEDTTGRLIPVATFA